MKTELVWIEKLKNCFQAQGSSGFEYEIDAGSNALYIAYPKGAVSAPFLLPSFDVCKEEARQHHDSICRAIKEAAPKWIPCDGAAPQISRYERRKVIVKKGMAATHITVSLPDAYLPIEDDVVLPSKTEGEGV